MLDGKVYVDTRIKAIDSKSDPDLFVELPRSVNVPYTCVCDIDDIVIPVSWSTIDGRNNKLYVYVKFLENLLYKIVEVPKNNYSGTTFAETLGVAINAAWYPE